MREAPAHVRNSGRHVGRLGCLLRPGIGLNLLQLPRAQRQVEGALQGS